MNAASIWRRNPEIRNPTPTAVISPRRARRLQINNSAPITTIPNPSRLIPTDHAIVVPIYSGTYSHPFWLVFELNKLVVRYTEELQNVVQFVAPVTVGDDRAGTVVDDVHKHQADGFGSETLLPLGVVLSPQRADVRIFNLLHYAFASFGVIQSRAELTHGVVQLRHPAALSDYWLFF
jgi:hypothetical protein